MERASESNSRSIESVSGQYFAQVPEPKKNP